MGFTSDDKYLLSVSNNTVEVLSDAHEWLCLQVRFKSCFHWNFFLAHVTAQNSVQNAVT